MEGPNLENEVDLKSEGSTAQSLKLEKSCLDQGETDQGVGPRETA
jgi:hypothetical protein